MSAVAANRSQAFLALLKGEMQNRAFALLALRAVQSKASSAEDLSLYQSWVAFEEFNQVRYAPFAEKYGVSQQAGGSARFRASLAKWAATVFPERLFLKFMHKETKAYVQKLQKLAELAPSEDKEFFDYVVRQEELQVEILTLRINGKTREADQQLRDFVRKHSGDRSQ